MSERKTNSKAEIKTTRSRGLGAWFVWLTIPIMLAVSILFYIYVLGDPSHFQGGNPANHPIQGDYFGIIYKGGVIVPLLLTLFLLVIVFSLERFFTINSAKGKGNLLKFVKDVRNRINNDQINEALAACDKQKGAVASVVKAGLVKYQQMNTNDRLEHEKKLLNIQQAIEEATQFEMPMLEKNLVIISTIASISTLVGLLGTVMGMIKAFSALATAGAPDAVALANGISEALINTALGILAAALAIISYNYFTNKIDSLTYKIDEIGYSIVQKFAVKDNK